MAALAVMASCGSVACKGKDKDDPHAGHNHNHAGGHVHGESSKEGKEKGGDEIVLEPEQAARFGLKTQKVQPGSFNNIVKVSGQFVDSPESSSMATSPTAGIITLAPGIEPGRQVSRGTLIATVKAQAVSGGDANAAAAAAMNAAKKEMERLKPLHEAGIVSTSQWNAAVAAYNTARAAYSPAASGGRIVAPSNGVIGELLVKSGQFVETGAPVASIGSAQRLTLRADVPQRYYNRLASFTGATIRMPGSDDAVDIRDLHGQRVASATGGAARAGYTPIYFTVNNNGTLVPGSGVEVFLQAEPREGVIVVPVGAVTEQQGQYFVYVKVDKEGYNKIPVTLGDSNGMLVEIKSGLKPGQEVVTAGAIGVRLAETSGAVPEGHSH